MTDLDPRVLAALACAAFAGCASAPRSTFRATDPTFAPRPGPTPPVYLERADVPDVAVRSVGVIEVKAPAGSDRAVAAAAAKGRELGCWAVIEHSVFVQLPPASASLFGARTILVHGPGAHASHAAPPLVTTEFDCVLRVDAAAPDRKPA